MDAAGAGGIDPVFVTILVGTSGAIGTVVAAIVGRMGTRQTRVNEQMSQLVDNLQEERDFAVKRADRLEGQMSAIKEQHRAELLEVRQDLRECEQLRRSEFEKAVKSMFLDKGENK